jgi:hypothetical protein
VGGAKPGLERLAHERVRVRGLLARGPQPGHARAPAPTEMDSCLVLRPQGHGTRRQNHSSPTRALTDASSGARYARDEDRLRGRPDAMFVAGRPPSARALELASTDTFEQARGHLR